MDLSFAEVLSHRLLRGSFAAKAASGKEDMMELR
jgi:hypothetical protein